jgi:hypothetical protein
MPRRRQFSRAVDTAESAPEPGERSELVTIKPVGVVARCPCPLGPLLGVGLPVQSRIVFRPLIRHTPSLASPCLDMAAVHLAEACLSTPHAGRPGLRQPMDDHEIINLMADEILGDRAGLGNVEGCACRRDTAADGSPRPDRTTADELGPSKPLWPGSQDTAGRLI